MSDDKIKAQYEQNTALPMGIAILVDGVTSRLRLANTKTLETIAAETGINVTTLFLIRGRRRVPDTMTLGKLLDRFGIVVDIETHDAVQPPPFKSAV